MTEKKKAVEMIQLRIETDAVREAAENAARSIEAWLEPIAAAEIADAMSSELAQRYLVDAQTKLRELEEQRDSFCEEAKAAKEKATAAYQKVMGLWAPTLELLKRFKLVQGEKISAWRTKERRRIEEVAERARQEALKAQEAERVRLRKEADRLEKKGLEEAAQRARDLSVAPMPLVVPVAAVEVEPRVKGIVERKEWLVEVTDFAKLPDMFKLPNLKALEDYAKRTDGAVEVPGVKFYCEIKTGGRRAK